MPRLATVLISLLILNQQVVSQATNTTEECRVPADPDTHGLGVRLGLYFQVLSVFVIAEVRRKEAIDTVVPTIFFFAAFLGAVIYSVATQSLPPGAIIACTWYPILMFIALATVSQDEATEGHPGARSVWVLMLWMTSAALNIWFWFRGVYVAHPAQCMEPRVFLFVDLPALGHARIFFAFCSVFFLVLWMGIAAYGMWMGTRLRRQRVEDLESSGTAEWTETAGKSPDATTVELTADANTVSLPPSNPQSGDGAQGTVIIENEEPHANDQQQPLITQAKTRKTLFEILVERGRSRIRKLAHLTFYIVASELQLVWNHLDGINTVNSTGQIIPLTIGSLALLRSIWLIWEEFESRKKTKEEPRNEGGHEDDCALHEWEREEQIRKRAGGGTKKAATI
jgi:hypothetical protein